MAQSALTIPLDSGLIKQRWWCLAGGGGGGGRRAEGGERGAPGRAPSAASEKQRALAPHNKKGTNATTADSRQPTAEDSATAAQIFKIQYFCFYLCLYRTLLCYEDASARHTSLIYVSI